MDNPATDGTTAPQTGSDGGGGGPFFTMPAGQAPAPNGSEGAGGEAQAGAGGAGDGAGPAGEWQPGQPKTFTYEKRRGEIVEFEVSADLLTDEGEIDGVRAALRQHDLRRKLAEKGIDLDAEPVAPPEKYVPTVPEELAGMFEIGEDDPELVAMTPVMQELEFSQEKFDKLFQAQLQYRAGVAKEEADLAAADRQLDIDYLAGEFGSIEAAEQAMNAQLGPWLASMVKGDDQTRALKEAALSAFGEVGMAAAALWDIYQGVRGAGLQTPGPGGGAPAALTEADVRALMRQDAYHDSGHPDHASLHKRVSDGWAALYGGTTPIAR